VEPCCFSVAPDSIEKDRLSDSPKANQHRTLRVPADSGAPKRNTHLLKECIPTRKLDRW